LHPIIAVLTGVFLVFASGLLVKECGKGGYVWRWSNILSILVLFQIAFCAATLMTLAPIVMQIGHLFLTDAIWVIFVLMTADFLAGKPAFYAPSGGSDSVAS